MTFKTGESITSHMIYEENILSMLYKLMLFSTWRNAQWFYFLKSLLFSRLRDEEELIAVNKNDIVSKHANMYHKKCMKLRPKFTFVQLIKIMRMKINPSMEKNEINTKSRRMARWVQLKNCTITSLTVCVFIKHKSQVKCKHLFLFCAMITSRTLYKAKLSKINAQC